MLLVLDKAPLVLLIRACFGIRLKFSVCEILVVCSVLRIAYSHEHVLPKRVCSLSLLLWGWHLRFRYIVRIG